MKKEFDKRVTTLYFTRIQEALVNDWVSFRKITSEERKTKSDIIFDTLFDAMRKNEDFNELIQEKNREKK